jgi:hypothetical protein
VWPGRHLRPAAVSKHFISDALWEAIGSVRWGKMASGAGGKVAGGDHRERCVNRTAQLVGRPTTLYQRCGRWRSPTCRLRDSMTSVLLELIRHKTWATQKLIALCQSLDPAMVDATVPGTYGTSRKTPVHLVNADRNP